MLIWKALRGRTQNADLIESFKSCELSKDLLLDPIKLASVHTRVTVFADVSNAFMTAFGHPAQSPWADLPLGDIHRYDIERLISKLTELRTVALELAGYFERYATPLTIETIDGIGQSIKLDRTIGDPPDGAPIAKISALDVDELARNLREKRTLIEVDHALSGKPDLSLEDPNHLALATSMIASGAPATLLNMQPATAYAAAAETVDQLSSVIRIIESSVPILCALSIGGDFPSNGLHTIAVATLVASRIPDQHHEWIGTLPRIDETAFSAAHDHWKRLRASESDWRRKLKERNSGPWPGADKLRAAAATVRRSGFSALVAAINGTRRAAHELTAQLGFSASSAILADQVGQLADHVQAMADFEADGDIAGLLGSFWQGILTPFDEIAAGAEIRRAIQGQLVALPGGERVTHQLLALPTDEFAALANFARTARSIQDGAENLRSFDGTPIDETLPAIRTQLAILNKFLLVDPARALAGVKISIQQISDVAKLLAQKSDISQGLARSPLAYAIEALGVIQADIDNAERAIDWIKSVQLAVSPGPLRTALTGSDAQAVRELLHEAALAGTAPSQSYMTLIESLSSEFGVSGLSCLLPNALVERLEFLTAHRAELADFLAIRDHRRELDDAGLADLLAYSDRLVLAPERLPALFETLVAFGQADLARRASPEFGRQDGATLEARRRTFAEHDRIKIKSDRSVVTARLLQKVPARGSDTGPRGVGPEWLSCETNFQSKDGLHLSGDCSPARAIPSLHSNLAL
jgi:hypothetical protein